MKSYMLFVLGITLSLSSFAENLTSFEVAKVIKSGTHSKQENEIHKQVCAKLGAVDVTDLSDIQLAANTSDAVI